MKSSLLEDPGMYINVYVRVRIINVYVVRGALGLELPYHQGGYPILYPWGICGRYAINRP